jgi:hypothetical protein
MSRTHLKDSDEPLQSGQDYVALCGKNVVKAEFVCRWEMGRLAETPISTIVFCQKCAVISAERRETNRVYLYGMVDGQESKSGSVS